MSTLGNRLKALRASDGRTQDEISMELKKYDIKADRGTVARWENDIQQPTLRPVKALADIYGVSTDYIIDGSGLSGRKYSNKQKLPVYARIASGFETGSQREITGWELIYSSKPDEKPEKFGFIITGDSMYPKYADGDVVIAVAETDVPSGKDVIVSIGRDDAVIRRVSVLEDGGIILHPYNDKYPVLSFSQNDIASLPVVFRGIPVEIRRRI